MARGCQGLVTTREPHDRWLKWVLVAEALATTAMLVMLTKTARPSSTISCRYTPSGIFTIAEKLLANGDKWEPELAAVIRADAPYR